ncbi:MAG: ELM1/GtrOC1 family putative glycosyltransferase [Pseudomonadota bacterium]
MSKPPSTLLKPPARLAWLLRAPGAGDNQQLASLAQKVAQQQRWFDGIDSVPRVLADRCWPGASSRMPKVKQAVFQPPWPDLVLIAGGRSVIDARRIQQVSGGRSKLIALGRPWAPLDWFDLVVTTPQYQLPPADNIIELTLPLHVPESDPSEGRLTVPGAWQERPRPWTGVVLGGDSGSYRFDEGTADDLIRRLQAHHAAVGGSLIVVGSPRTPNGLMNRLTRSLPKNRIIHRWHPDDPDDPYPRLLQHADELLVTADSASMLSDAVRSGKPVSLLPLQPRLHSRLLKRWHSLNLPGRSIKQSLVKQGWWIPARDLERLHQRAFEQGQFRHSSERSAINASEASARSERLDQELSTVINRVRSWFDR